MRVSENSHCPVTQRGRWEHGYAHNRERNVGKECTNAEHLPLSSCGVQAQGKRISQHWGHPAGKECWLTSTQGAPICRHTKAVQRRPNRSKGVIDTRYCLGRTLRFQGLRGDGDIQGDAKSWIRPRKETSKSSQTLQSDDKAKSGNCYSVKILRICNRKYLVLRCIKGP